MRSSRRHCRVLRGSLGHEDSFAPTANPEHREEWPVHTDSVCQSQFVSMNGSTTPVLSRLSFLAGEPFAVTIAFRTDRGHWVEWAFARELLVLGLREPTGI